MFSETAKWYDLLYSFKDYQQESEEIISLLHKEHPNAKTLLDVACGTAEHDRYFARHYAVDGLDVEKEFIAIASTKNPSGTYFCSNMTDFTLDRTYDLILCLFSSIGYVKTIENVTKALRCFSKHLNEDGLIVVEPWFTPDSWKPGNVYMLTAESGDRKICRMNLGGERKDTLSFLNFHYLVGTSAGVHYYTEHHELGLFTKEEMLQAFRDVDLDVEYDQHGITGRGLYLARLQKNR